MKKLRVKVNGISYDVEVEILEEDEGALNYGFPMPHPHLPPVHLHNPVHDVPKQPSASSHHLSDDKKNVTCPIAGIIVDVKVAPGSQVKENETLLVIEAMKMNTNIGSPVSGKVKEVKVKAKDNVQQGQILVIFE